ncbi:hypothetical protein Tco_0162495 [Tanacetum coccineum]
MFQTLSLDELRSPDFNLLSDEGYSDEEEEEEMAETIEQYMSKTRTDYGSGVARLNDNKDQFETKRDILKSFEITHLAVRYNVDLDASNATGTPIPQGVPTERRRRKLEDAYYYTHNLVDFFKEGHIEQCSQDMPEDIRVPLILGRPFLSTARAKIDLDLEARLMGETLVINRSLDPFFEDYIELNDLNEPFELRRNQGDDFMPTIEEGFEFTHVNFFPLLYVNVMSKKFHNSIMKEKMVYKGNNVIRALMNVPIFVGTFSVMTDFVVIENMDAYRDEGMGDVILGEPFLREVGIKTKRFKEGLPFTMVMIK